MPTSMRSNSSAWGTARPFPFAVAAARLAFADVFAVVREDRRHTYGEDRFILLGMVEERLLASPMPYAPSVRASSRRALPNHESDDATMRKPAKHARKIDWSRADAMTAKQRRTAAWADPDNKPMTEAEWRAAPRLPQVSIIRRALKLSQEDFAAAFHI